MPDISSLGVVRNGLVVIGLGSDRLRWGALRLDGLLCRRRLVSCLLVAIVIGLSLCIGILGVFLVVDDFDTVGVLISWSLGSSALLCGGLVIYCEGSARVRM